MIAFAGPLPDGQIDTPRQRAYARMLDQARRCQHFGAYPCSQCIIDIIVETDAEAFEFGRAFERSEASARPEAQP